MAQKEEVFLNAGLDRNEAKVLNRFFEEDKLFSRQIEHELRMRQPEASIALGRLVERGWLTYKEIRGKGKGRPQHLYSLKESKKTIITELINNLRTEQEKIEKTISKLELKYEE